MLEKFKDIWDWDEYSDYGSFTEEIVERFADRLNWRKLINNHSLYNWDVEAFSASMRTGFQCRISRTQGYGTSWWKRRGLN